MFLFTLCGNDLISAPARSASLSLALLDLTAGFHQSAPGEAQPVMHSDTPSEGNWRSAALAPNHFGAFKYALRYPNAKVKPEPASGESFSDPWMVGGIFWLPRRIVHLLMIKNKI